MAEEKEETQKEQETEYMPSDKDKEDVKKTRVDSDVESEDDKKYPYPKSVFFIISTEFCERFSYYGMKSK
jgi:solute carrier family 15 oligopeptide transporter 1